MQVATDISSGFTRTAEPEPRLRAIRHAQGLTGEELAARAGLSLRTIYAAEVDGVRPHRSTRRVLALALGCEIEDIFPNDVEPAGNRLDEKARVTARNAES